MRQIYLRVEENELIRKVAIDMASLFSLKQIRLPKFYFEDGLYIPFKQKNSEIVEKHFLTKDKIIKEDDNFYYFDFPFKFTQIENTAN